jgi:hypothetical protein
MCQAGRVTHETHVQSEELAIKLVTEHEFDRLQVEQLACTHTQAHIVSHDCLPCESCGVTRWRQYAMSLGCVRAHRTCFAPSASSSSRRHKASSHGCACAQ